MSAKWRRSGEKELELDAEGRRGEAELQDQGTKV